MDLNHRPTLLLHLLSHWTEGIMQSLPKFLVGKKEKGFFSCISVRNSPRRSQNGKLKHSDKGGDPTTHGNSRSPHTDTHNTHTRTACSATARPATWTFTKSDGQISNRRLLTKRLTP